MIRDALYLRLIFCLLKSQEEGHFISSGAPNYIMVTRLYREHVEKVRAVVK